MEIMANILVIDDDRGILTVIKTILESAGHEVTVASDPHEGLNFISRGQFQLLLTDANMPELSGFDLVKEVRRKYNHKTLAIALLTGRKEKQDVKYALECGADDYIVKPIDPPLLLAKVVSLVGSVVHEVEVTFAEVDTVIEASWDCQTQITNITENGMTLWSAISPAVGATVMLKSSLFQTLDITAPPLRVESCTPDQSRANAFLISVQFVGLNDKESQKLRMWINMEKTKGRSIKAS
jgi:CheY-like chemotaxis protein